MNPLLHGLPVLLGGLMLWALISSVCWRAQLTWLVTGRALALALPGWAWVTLATTAAAGELELPVTLWPRTASEVLHWPSMLGVVVSLPAVTVLEARARQAGFGEALHAALLACLPRGWVEWIGALCWLCAVLMLSLSELLIQGVELEPMALLFAVCAAIATALSACLGARALRRQASRARGAALLGLAIVWCSVCAGVSFRAQDGLAFMLEARESGVELFSKSLDPYDLEWLPKDPEQRSIYSRNWALLRFLYTGQDQEHLTPRGERIAFVPSPDELLQAEFIDELPVWIERSRKHTESFTMGIVLLAALAAGLGLFLPRQE